MQKSRHVVLNAFLTNRLHLYSCKQLFNLWTSSHFSTNIAFCNQTTLIESLTKLSIENWYICKITTTKKLCWWDLGFRWSWYKRNTSRMFISKWKKLVTWIEMFSITTVYRFKGQGDSYNDNNSSKWIQCMKLYCVAENIGQCCPSADTASVAVALRWSSTASTSTKGLSNGTNRA